MGCVMVAPSGGKKVSQRVGKRADTRGNNKAVLMVAPLAGKTARMVPTTAATTVVAKALKMAEKTADRTDGTRAAVKGRSMVAPTVAPSVLLMAVRTGQRKAATMVDMTAEW